MIDDKILAAEVNEKLLSANRAIVDAVKLVEERGAEQEIRAFRAEAANVAGQLFTVLLRPLWQAFPELAPEGMGTTPSPKKKGKR
ncbi:hypothetical protein [Paraburkholderia sediminicola]|uniref:hypothetical protein n=1 Tax=Paraburkholderia sediminicola TaxID=458836 RepID=UPI0038B7B55E